MKMHQMVQQLAGCKGGQAESDLSQEGAGQGQVRDDDAWASEVCSSRALQYMQKITAIWPPQWLARGMHRDLLVSRSLSS